MNLSLAQKAVNAVYALKGRPPKFLTETAHVGSEAYSGITDKIDKIWNTLENPDALVGKKGYRIYDEMVDRDPTIKSGLSYRMAMMLAPDHRVKPYDEDSGDDRYWADFVAWNFEHMEEGVDRTHYHMGFRSQSTGIYIGEIVWHQIERGPYAGMWGIKTIKQRYPDSFDFKPDAYGNLKGPDAFTQLRNDGERKRLNPDKFIIYPFEFRDSNWWGNARLRPAYKYYHLGDYCERYAAIYSEKHSGPTIGMKYPPGTPLGEVTQLIDAMKKLKNMGIWAIPSDWEHELTSPGPVHVNFFEWVTSYCNKMKVRAIMVPELLQSEGEGHGSYKLAVAQIDVPLVISLGYDSNDLEGVWHRQVTKRLIELNDPKGKVEHYPRFMRDAIKGAPDENMLRLEENISNGIWPEDPEIGAWFARLFGMPHPPEVTRPKPSEAQSGNGNSPAPGASDVDEMAESIRKSVFAQMEEDYSGKKRFAHNHEKLAAEIESFAAATASHMSPRDRKRVSQAEASAWIQLLKYDTEDSGVEAFGAFPIDRMLHGFERRLKEDG